MLKLFMWGCFTWIFLVGAIISHSEANVTGTVLPPEVANKSKDKLNWDKRYAARSGYLYGKAPAKFLASNYDFIPPRSQILDLGMGEGRNAVFLAAKGHIVTGIDISSVAIKKAKLLAREFGVRIKAIEADVAKYNFPPQSFDAIVLFYYLNREQLDKVVSWLKPSGVLVVENFTLRQNDVQGADRINPEYLFKEQELPRLFKGMRLLKYEEPVHKAPYTASGIFQKSDANRASL